MYSNIVMESLCEFQNISIFGDGKHFPGEVRFKPEMLELKGCSKVWINRICLVIT